jgi:hypothetical protein
MTSAESARGWTKSRIELIKIQLLDLVDEHCRNVGPEPVESYAGHLTGDQQLLDAAARSLVANDLVYDGASYAGTLSPYPTQAGKDLVLVRRERRSDPRSRAVACREALLDWSYQNGRGIDEFAGDVRAHFEGDPFTPEEIRNASRDLKQMELVSGETIRPQITPTGKTVVEHYDSSISSYGKQNQPASSQTIEFKGNTISGQISIGDHNQLGQRVGADAAELADLVAVVIEAARGTAEEERVGKLVAQLQLEADEDEPEPATVKKGLERLKGVVVETGSKALGFAVTQLGKYFFKHYGISCSGEEPSLPRSEIVGPPNTPARPVGTRR